MVQWHHHLNGHEFEQTPGDGEGQGSLACCSLWGLKESDTTEQLSLSLFKPLVLEKTLENPLDCKEIIPVNPKENQPKYSLEGLMLKLKLQYFSHLM